GGETGHREGADVGFHGGASVVLVDDLAGLPAWCRHHADLTVAEREVVLRVVAVLRRTTRLLDELLALGQALHRLIGVEDTLPRTAVLDGDVAAVDPDERQRREPVLAR